MRYDFEWDPEKAQENRRKHRVSFARGAEAFLDPQALSIFDDEHSDGEERWITLGLDRSGALLVVVHTFDPLDATRTRIRIISARKASQKETRQYAEGLS